MPSTSSERRAPPAGEHPEVRAPGETLGITADARSEPSQGSGGARAAAERDRRPQVLLVEDDDDNRELMAEVLAASGYQVLPAASGPEGLRLLAERSVDVVVTDVGMPGMGGLEVARAAKAIAPAVPVVVVTGWAERDDITRARGREVDAVLIKPVAPEALTGTLERVLSGARPYAR
jgi:two-component system, OmpR family, response regulator